MSIQEGAGDRGGISLISKLLIQQNIMTSVYLPTSQGAPAPRGLWRAEAGIEKPKGVTNAVRHHLPYPLPAALDEYVLRHELGGRRCPIPA